MWVFVRNNWFLMTWLFFTAFYVPIEIWAVQNGGAPGSQNRLEGVVFAVLIVSFLVTLFFPRRKKAAQNDVAITATPETKRVTRNFKWRVYPALIGVFLLFLPLVLFSHVPSAYAIWVVVGLSVMIIDRALRKQRAELNE